MTCLKRLIIQSHKSHLIKKASLHLLFNTNWYTFANKYQLVYNIEPET